MNVFDRYRNWRDKPGPGIYEDSPKEGRARYWFLFKNHFWELMRLNLLFILFSIPLFTLPAAMAGMTSVLMKLTRTGNSFLWDDFKTEFKRDFLHRTPVGLLFTAIPASAYMIAQMRGNLSAGVGLLLGLSLLIYPMSCWWYASLVTLDLPIESDLKNAFALVSMEWKTSLYLDAMFLIYFGCWFTLPYSVPAFILVTFAFVQLGACVCIWPVMQRRLVRPENAGTEERPAEKDSGDGFGSED